MKPELSKQDIAERYQIAPGAKASVRPKVVCLPGDEMLLFRDASTEQLHGFIALGVLVRSEDRTVKKPARKRREEAEE